MQRARMMSIGAPALAVVVVLLMPLTSGWAARKEQVLRRFNRRDATGGFARYVITNDDVPTIGGNSATIYQIGARGALTQITVIKTGGTGIGGGDYSTARVNTLRSQTQDCAYVSDALGPNGKAPGDVAAINMKTLKLAGAFPGSTSDVGNIIGVGLAEDPKGTYLFAAYTTSATIATYKRLPGCKLKFLGDATSAVGLNGGAIDGMRVTSNGKYLIAAYADKSIGSWRIEASGLLSLIGNITTTDGRTAVGVDISGNGKYAIFGVSTAMRAMAEVSPIAADGSLGATTAYGIGKGDDGENVWLSPDEHWIYITNNTSGQFGAAPFNKVTGVIDTAKSCTSKKLKGFGVIWPWLSGLATRSTVGTGAFLYGAEWNFGGPSGIAIVGVTVKGGACTLKETAASPVADPTSPGLLSIGVYPPRKF
jgi:hypothetical protein